jgi:hypothetical protein
VGFRELGDDIKLARVVSPESLEGKRAHQQGPGRHGRRYATDGPTGDLKSSLAEQRAGDHRLDHRGAGQVPKPSGRSGQRSRPEG